MIAQRVVTERLLPVPRLGEDLAALVPMAASPGFNLDYDRDGRIDAGSQIDYLYEPDAAAHSERPAPAVRAVPRSSTRCSSRRPPSTPPA